MILSFSSNEILRIKNAFVEAIQRSYSEEEAENIFYLISEYHLGIDRSTYFLHQNRALSESEILHFEKAAIDLIRSIPIQYILGETMFYGCKIRVDERVLIPRPETEELVDMITREHMDTLPLNILDIGTGSGCIAIALAKEVNYKIACGVDVSEGALELARINAENNKVEVEFVNDSILDPQQKYNVYDIIISNPPYIEESRRKLLEKRVVDHEPNSALFVPDEDPLIFYKAIIDFSQIHLKDTGTLYLEINEAFPFETKSLFYGRDWTAQVVLDIEGNSRFIKALKN